MPNSTGPTAHHDGIPANLDFQGDDTGAAFLVGRIRAGELLAAVHVGVSPPSDDRWGEGLAAIFGGLGWAAEAACGGHSARAEEFAQPGTGLHPPEAARKLAEEFCARCPVIAECADDASARFALGVWGGSHRTGKTDTAQRKPYRAVPLIDSAPPHIPATAAVTSPAAVVTPPPATALRKAIA